MNKFIIYFRPAEVWVFRVADNRPSFSFVDSLPSFDFVDNRPCFNSVHNRSYYFTFVDSRLYRLVPDSFRFTGIFSFSAHFLALNPSEINCDVGVSDDIDSASEPQ